MISGPMKPTEIADLDLPVIRRDDEHGPGTKVLQDVTDEAIDRPQLVVVVAAQPFGVGHLVDALVVGVHKRGAAGRSARGLRSRARPACASGATPAGPDGRR